MVLPFALAVGSYPILFLLLSILLYHSQLHSVQLSGATLGWFDLGDDFASTNFALTSIEFDLPTGHSNVVVVTMPFVSHEDGGLFALRDDRRLWDPGIHQFVGRNTTMFDPIATMMDLLMPLIPAHVALRLDVVGVDVDNTMRRLWDPGIRSTARAQRGAPATDTWINLSNRMASTSLFGQTIDLDPLRPMPTTTLPTNTCRRALALIQSLFQYFHPVLSRPTVPNIQ
mgnify:CR=1 FL=1